MRRMPLAKSLSYLFARATGQGILCGNMMVKQYGKPPSWRDWFRGGDGYRDVYRWVEATPVRDGRNNYTLKTCHYIRRKGDVSHERDIYQELRLSVPGMLRPEMSRWHAADAMKNTESQWKGQGFVPPEKKPPLSLRLLNIKRHLP